MKLKTIADFIYDELKPELSKKHFYLISINSVLNDKFIAYSSGIGAFMKNSLLSINNKGSKFVIGSILLKCKIDFKEKVLLENPCGSCTRCIDGCPTGAIKKNGVIDKDRCLQHLSCIPRWDKETLLSVVTPSWGNRFFGCSFCTDICPFNKKSSNHNVLPDEIPGYIGTIYNIGKMENIKPGYFKDIFAGNQLSANWIPEVALIRNLLLYLYKQEKYSMIMEFYENMGQNGFLENEISDINFFIKSLPDL